MLTHHALLRKATTLRQQLNDPAADPEITAAELATLARDSQSAGAPRAVAFALLSAARMILSAHLTLKAGYFLKKENREARRALKARAEAAAFAYLDVACDALAHGIADPRAEPLEFKLDPAKLKLLE